MTLSKREQVLAGVVGVLLVGAAAYAGWGVVARPLLNPGAVLTGMEQQLELKRQHLEVALKAKETMADLRLRSLPPDLSVAKGEYQTWLLQLAEKHLRNHKVDQVSVGSTTRAKDAPPFKPFSFTVKGQASLSKVIGFLYDFYSAGYLHQVHKLSLTPVLKSADLEVNIEVQALSLLDAPSSVKLVPIKPARPLPADLAAYDKEIAGRKPFSPYQEPRGPTPPPPPPPIVVPFDPSKYAVITGIVRGVDDVLLVFVSCHTTGEKLRLRSGQKVEVGSFKGVIGRIADREVEILLADKSEPIRRSVGDSLTKSDQPETKPAEPAPGSAETKGKPPTLAEKTAGPPSRGRDGGGPSRDFSKFGGKKGGKRGRGFGSGDSGPGNFGPGGPSRDGGDKTRKREG